MDVNVGPQLAHRNQEVIEYEEMARGRTGKAQNAARVPGTQLSAGGPSREEKQIASRDPFQDTAEMLPAVAKQIPHVLTQKGATEP